ncbi:hypothetical protein BD289DRAFT_424793 [Coniella lustricola]|uniref:Uncharacterized protein n=1 Tax=Coniella lustricola TaxID=2025994 RepID=A0A2T3AHT2_9PEZI|nr:hypothetical protein BD289DRAFT_424793 [Coniella lustricola]
MEKYPKQPPPPKKKPAQCSTAVSTRWVPPTDQPARRPAQCLKRCTSCVIAWIAPPPARGRPPILRTMHSICSSVQPSWHSKYKGSIGTLGQFDRKAWMLHGRPERERQESEKLEWMIHDVSRSPVEGPAGGPEPGRLANVRDCTSYRPCCAKNTLRIKYSTLRYAGLAV